MIRPVRAVLSGACAMLVLAAVAVTAVSTTSPATADEMSVEDGIPSQADVDGLTIGSDIGGWAAMAGGLADRPFVKYLSMVNGGVETVAIDNRAGEMRPAADPAAGIDAVITPYNLCAPGKQPGVDNCYRKPNRVGIIVGYVADGRLHSDFDSELARSTGVTVDHNTVINLTIGLNALGSTLRWSWVTGLPTSWQVTRLGEADGELRISFRPMQRPFTSNGGGCTQIPVDPTCQFPVGSRYTRSAELLLSLDTTLDAAFTGALFATDKAYIGSLDTQFSQRSVYPTITWGMSAPAVVAGERNTPRIWAFLSEAALLNSFGIPPGTSPRSLVGLEVDTGPGDPLNGYWQQWTAEANGTAGWLISSGQVPVTTTVTSGFGRATRRVARTVVVRAERRAAVNVSAIKRSSGVFVAASDSGRFAKACQRSGCRARIWELGSRTSTAPVIRSTDSVSAENGTFFASKILSGSAGKGLSKGDRLMVVIQTRGKPRGTWDYLTSGIAVIG